MWGIDIAHSPHLYGFVAAGLVLVAAMALYILELRSGGRSPWSEPYQSRVPVRRGSASPATTRRR